MEAVSVYLFYVWYFSEDFQKEDKTSDRSVFAAKLPKWRPLSLPFQLLLKPLQKRFIFHFYGNKKTNSLDKVCKHGLLVEIIRWQVTLCYGISSLIVIFRVFSVYFAA